MLSSHDVPLNRPPIQDIQCNILERVIDFPKRDACMGARLFRTFSTFNVGPPFETY